MSSSFSSLFPQLSSSSSSLITREEFNSFHKIDRTLFTLLIFSLNRDIHQSYEVMGFIFLLEQYGYARNLIAYLISLPEAFIDTMANEIVVCLSFLYNQHISPTSFDNDVSIIPLIVHLTGGRLTLRYIHQNRETFLSGLRKNLSEICDRAFEDIRVRAERYNKEKLLALQREKFIEEMNKITLSGHQGTAIRLRGQQETAIWSSVQQETAESSSVQTEMDRIPPLLGGKEEVNETTIETEEEVVVEADDRTVFLTFSKGYPISEEEVRAYFTRRFGEVIEVIIMHEVEENEQPLYARMVMRSNCMSKIEEIVTGRNRNKFTINGKHVWARKYVRKNPSSASSSSSHI